MVAAINGAGPGRHPPPLKFPVEVSANENDPSMKIKVTGRTLSISGVASNRGTVASFAQFIVAGKKININLSRGTTAAQVLKALAKKLPQGYSIQGTASSFQIMKGGPISTGPTKSHAKAIARLFADALKVDSPGKGLMTMGELHKAFKLGLVKGQLSPADKEALALGWATLYRGAGFLATSAAQAEYRRLEAKFDLPQFGLI